MKMCFSMCATAIHFYGIQKPLKAKNKRHENSKIVQKAYYFAWLCGVNVTIVFFFYYYLISCSNSITYCCDAVRSRLVLTIYFLITWFSFVCVCVCEILEFFGRNVDCHNYGIECDIWI